MREFHKTMGIPSHYFYYRADVAWWYVVGQSNRFVLIYYKIFLLFIITRLLHLVLNGSVDWWIIIPFILVSIGLYLW